MAEMGQPFFLRQTDNRTIRGESFPGGDVFMETIGAVAFFGEGICNMLGGVH